MLETTMLKLDSNSEPSTLIEGDKLASCQNVEGKGCDLFGLYFKPSQDAYIYALLQDSSGKMFPLFPKEEHSSQVNPVPAATEVWVLAPGLPGY